jgi:hypothetical protein
MKDIHTTVFKKRQTNLEEGRECVELDGIWLIRLGNGPATSKAGLDGVLEIAVDLLTD